MTHEELYDNISRVLTEYEQEHTFYVPEWYELLVEVQNLMASNGGDINGQLDN